jgi:enoyl-CoA hydratase/carnithine racemase
MIGFTINSESERIALCQSLMNSEEALRVEVINTVVQMGEDLDNGGKQYWTEKLMDLSIDLKVTKQLLERAKTAKKIEEIKEDDL